jgi:hypothetical protein
MAAPARAVDAEEDFLDDVEIVAAEPGAAKDIGAVDLEAVRDVFAF